LSSKSEWKRLYFQAIDIITTGLQERFDQPGMRIAAAREDVLLCGIRMEQLPNFKEACLKGFAEDVLINELQLLANVWTPGMLSHNYIT
jgi:hypothetical protein